MPDISSDSETAVLDLDNSLSEDDRADMFSLKNAMHVISSVKNYKILSEVWSVQALSLKLTYDVSP